MLPSALLDGIVGKIVPGPLHLSYRVALSRAPDQRSEDIRSWLIEQGFEPAPKDGSKGFSWLHDEVEFWDIKFEDASKAVLFKLKFG